MILVENAFHILTVNEKTNGHIEIIVIRPETSANGIVKVKAIAINPEAQERLLAFLQENLRKHKEAGAALALVSPVPILPLTDSAASPHTD